MTWCRHDADTASDLSVAIEDGVLGAFEVDPLRDGVVRLPGDFVFDGLDEYWHARKRHVVPAVVEVEMGVDNESNIGDTVAVHLELRFNRAVNDLVVVVKEFVAPTDPSFVQDQSRSMAQREREDFTCLSAQGV